MDQWKPSAKFVKLDNINHVLEKQHVYLAFPGNLKQMQVKLNVSMGLSIHFKNHRDRLPARLVVLVKNLKKAVLIV